MSPEEKPLNAAPGPAPAESNEEPKTPAEIRAEIDQTREELGDTVEALAEKTDVKAQAKAKDEDAADDDLDNDDLNEDLDLDEDDEDVNYEEEDDLDDDL